LVENTFYTDETNKIIKKILHDLKANSLIHHDFDLSLDYEEEQPKNSDELLM